MEKEEVNNKLDTDLGISLDFEEESNVDETDDNFLIDAVDKDDSASTVNNPDDINNIDINKEFDKLLDNATIPGDVDSITKDKKELDTSNTNDGTQAKDSSDSLMTVAFVKSLQTQGLNDFDEESYINAVKEKGEATAFVDILEKLKDSKSQSYRESLDSYAEEYIRFRENGFSQEDASILVNNKETVLSITDESLGDNEQMQESIISEVSKIRGMSDDEIKEQIDLLKDTDKLKTRATSNLKLLKDYHVKLADKQLADKKLSDLENKKSIDAYKTSLKDDIYNTTEIINGKKINQQTKDNIYNDITTPLKLKDGTYTNSIWKKRRDNQIDFDKKLAYYIRLGLFEGNIKNLNVDNKTKVVSEIEKTLEGSRIHTSGSPNIPIEQSNGDRLNAMNIFLED